MPSDTELVKLHAAIADIDEELQKLKTTRLLSAGEKLLKQYAWQHERRKLELRIKLFQEKELIEQKARECGFYQTPLGKSVIEGRRHSAEKHHQRRLAGLALGGGSSTPYRLRQKDVFTPPDPAAAASIALTEARRQHAATSRELEKLCSNGNKASRKLNAKKTEYLVFTKGRDGSFQVQPGYSDVALMNTYKQMLPILLQVRAFLLARGNEKSAKALQRRFGSTALGKVATRSNWELWIDDFARKTTPKAATIFFLHEATGVKCETLRPHLSRIRKELAKEK